MRGLQTRHRLAGEHPKLQRTSGGPAHRYSPECRRYVYSLICLKTLEDILPFVCRIYFDLFRRDGKA